MSPEPCGLALTLLSRAEVCPACEHIAGNHPRWLRELARGAIPNPDPFVEEELEEGVPLEAIAVPRVRWAIGGGRGALLGAFLVGAGERHFFACENADVFPGATPGSLELGSPAPLRALSRALLCF